jgi:hypothetical protein
MGSNSDQEDIPLNDGMQLENRWSSDPVWATKMASFKEDRRLKDGTKGENRRSSEPVWATKMNSFKDDRRLKDSMKRENRRSSDPVWATNSYEDEATDPCKMGRKGKTDGVVSR